jgi:hypothetical protein
LLTVFAFAGDSTMTMFMKSVLAGRRNLRLLERVDASCLRIKAKMVTELVSVNFTQGSELTTYSCIYYQTQLKAVKITLYLMRLDASPAARHRL